MQPTMAIFDVGGPYCRHVSVHVFYPVLYHHVPACPSHVTNSTRIDLTLLPRCFPTLGGPLCNQQWPFSTTGGHTAAMYRYTCVTTTGAWEYLLGAAVLSIRLGMT